MGAPDERHADLRTLLSGGHLQNRVAEREAKVRVFRVFESMIIPGLLQIPEYARVCLSHAEPLFGLRHDVDEAVQVRMQRQEILHQPDRRFHFVITEAALRYRLCEPKIMLAQLQRLIPFTTLPTMTLGVIDFKTQYGVAFPNHGFWLHDNARVTTETFSALLNLTEPHEIELYGKVFDSLAGIASYGEAAREIIERAIDDLSAEVEEDPPRG